MMEGLLSFLKPAIIGEQTQEAPAPREEIARVADYLEMQVVDSRGKRLKERDVRRTLRTLEALL